MNRPLVVVAGANGELGHRVAAALVRRSANVRAVVRSGSVKKAQEALKGVKGVEIAPVDFKNIDSVAAACKGAMCVVSTVNGLRDVIVDTQTLLLDGAVKAGVPRFIPSDFSVDLFKVPKGHNRNFDLRQEFAQRLERAPIKATSILNGGFMDMLPQVAVNLYWRRVIYVENENQPLQFTTMDNTAEFTAAAALDASTPRKLCCAGSQRSARELAADAAEVTGQQFKTLRVGSLSGLQTVINIMRKLYPAEKNVFPPWQAMMYMHNMFSGVAFMERLDNDRYPDIKWTTAKDVLRAEIQKQKK